MKEFKINDFITLKLENSKTVIYVSGKPFMQCKALIINIPTEEISFYNEIESIDDVIDKSQEIIYKIPAEIEFWGHCSNMQVWTENNYDTSLLDIDLAFPLLKRLVNEGDTIAKKTFKDEIARRLESGNENVINFLILEGYLKFLSKEEFQSLSINPIETLDLSNDIFKDYFDWFKNLSSLKKLNLRDNSFDKVPEKIKSLKDLEELDLSRNSLVTLPVWFNNFQKLKRLILISNSFDKVPEVIRDLKNLEELDLSSNIIRSLPKWFNSLKLLRSLNLGYNSLEDFPKSINRLRSLENLNLVDNSLNNIPGWIGELKKLKKLNLKYNNISKIPRSVNNLVLLEELNLSHNRLI